MSTKYWRQAAQSLIRNLRDRDFARDLASSGLRRDSEPRAHEVFALDHWAGLDAVTAELDGVRFTRSNLDPMEQYLLAGLCQMRQPSCVFEIGTYDGATTVILARNAPSAEVLTLDLPPDEAGSATVADEVRNAGLGVGMRFLDAGARISQLFGDSRTFDFSPWFGLIDMVLVDGGHEYDCAEADTRNMLQLLAPGGIVIWDDYIPGWPGVVRAVEESPPFRRGEVVRVAGTGFAVYDTGGRQPLTQDA